MSTETHEQTKPVAKPKAAAPAPDKKPLMTVMALRAGTYPDPGDTYPRYRKAGAVFVLNDNEDFSEWMRELSPGEKAELPEPAKNIPQTTGRGQQKLSPFPPLH